MEPSLNELSHEAFIKKMQIQYFDAVEGLNSDDWSFVPIGILDHKISRIPKRKIIHKGDQHEIQITTDCHIRVKTCWRNGETSWVDLGALKEQNPWVVISYVSRCKLTHHPDFK